jgi:hypothetical protein
MNWIRQIVERRSLERDLADEIQEHLAETGAAAGARVQSSSAHGLARQGCTRARVETFDRILSSGVAAPRFQVLLMGSFAAIALLLTATGLYGVLSYAVLRRTREIGLRIALGASRSAILTMVIGRAMTLTSIAVPIGVAGAAATGAMLRPLVYVPGSASPLLLAVACAVVAATAIVAALVPARRAASIDLPGLCAPNRLWALA